VPIWDATTNRVIVMPDGHISYNGYMVLPTGFPVASNSFTLIAIMEKQSARKPGADEALVTPSYLIAGSVANTCNLYHDAAGVFIANTGGISHGTLPVPTNLSMTLVSCDDTTLRLRINEQEETFASEDSAVTFTEANILGLIGAFGAGPWQARVKHFVLYDRVLDAGEVTQIMEWATAQGVNLAPTKNLAFEGDSICTGALADPFLGWVPLMNLSNDIRQNNMAQSGYKLSESVAAAATEIDNRIDPSADNAVIVTCGVNDIAAGDSAATIYANLATYGAARKTAGWDKVAIFGITPFGVTDTVRQALRTLLLADFTVATATPNIYAAGVGVTYADFYVDIAADTTIGIFAARLDTTYYVDGLHPTNAGHVVLETYGSALVDLLFP
jgi:lysophospholipase L1-like esterase